MMYPNYWSQPGMSPELIGILLRMSESCRMVEKEDSEKDRIKRRIHEYLQKIGAPKTVREMHEHLGLPISKDTLRTYCQEMTKTCLTRTTRPVQNKQSVWQYAAI